jgi:cell division protein FtsB
VVLAAVAFAVIVVGAMLPWSTLASQHRALSSDTAKVNQLQVENQALSSQVRQLSDPSAVTGLARENYGLVRPGQRAYDILPPSGSSSSAATDTGHVPLNQAPVVPGSRRSQELLSAGLGNAASRGSASAATHTGTAAGSVSSAGRAPAAPTPPAGGFWSRVAHTLAFWS